MSTFVLTTKTGEVINRIDIDGIENAVEYFCQVKKLDVKDLLNIYSVVNATKE